MFKKITFRKILTICAIIFVVGFLIGYDYTVLTVKSPKPAAVETSGKPAENAVTTPEAPTFDTNEPEKINSSGKNNIIYNVD